jgi:hypothetical protein
MHKTPGIFRPQDRCNTYSGVAPNLVGDTATARIGDLNTAHNHFDLSIAIVVNRGRLP